MIRILTIIIFYTFSSVVSFAQIKSEEILIKNNEIELPGTLTFTSEKTPLLIGFMVLVMLTETETNALM